MGWRKVAGALALLCAVTGCTSSVTGSPAGPDSKTATGAGDPCGLLTPEQAAGLGLVPQGKPEQGDPQRTLPPYCRWNPDEPDPRKVNIYDGLAVMYSTTVPVDRFHPGEPPIGQLRSGGLAWARYETIVGPNRCSLAVKLGGASFVEVTSEDYTDQAKSCDRAKLALPQVAAHLPGGLPAPPLRGKPKSSASPLIGIEPCDLFAPADLVRFQLQPPGEKTGTGRGAIGGAPGCQWETSPTSEYEMIYLYLDPARSADEAAGDESVDEQVRAADRIWRLYTNVSGNPRNCEAVLPVAAKSAVAVTGGSRNDPTKACDLVRQVIEFLTPKIPPG
ncbi:DUF3558 family protein [Amycolatopsis minnesotensis]|uniref:DUF3558 domain-containing protein n=1 Tax=Amycolatopsis minnesotensis TaxID=337894 RepID=A0ABN2QJ45_9PSEU